MILLRVNGVLYNYMKWRIPTLLQVRENNGAAYSCPTAGEYTSTLGVYYINKYREEGDCLDIEDRGWVV